MSLENAVQAPSNPLHRRAGDLPEDVPRDRWGRPEIMLPGGGSKHYTRASTLGGALEDQTNLGEWKKRVAVFGVVRRPDLILAAKSVETWDHPDDKRRLKDIAEQAMQSAEANAAATIGTALHALTDRIDRGQDIPDVGEHRHALDAYRRAIAHYTVHAIETFTVCDELETAGTFDRLLSPVGPVTVTDAAGQPVLDEHGQPVVISPGDRLIGDLKTAGTDAFFGIKFAVQLAVYAHAVPYQHGKGRLEWPDGIAPRTDWALIMHAPSGGSSAMPYWVDLRKGWELAKLSVTVREWRKDKTLVVPAQMPELEVDLMAEIERQPAGPGLRASLTALWSQHASAWTPEHTEAVKRRLAGA